ncbi:hypothetical protein FCV43_02115, partial [Vibrio genomosp. F6]
MDFSALVAGGISSLDQIMVIDLNGNVKVLKEGEIVLPGELVIENNISDMTDLTASEAQVSRVNDQNELDDITDDIEQIFAALEEGQDPTQINEEFATAAGTNSGSSLITSGAVERDGAEVLADTNFVTSGLEALGLSQTQSLSLLEAYQTSSATPVLPITLDAPSVVITEDTNNDGTLTNSEIDGLVDVLVTPPANANVGDTLTVSGQPDRVLTQDDLDNGVTYQYPVPADGESLTVTATVTDPSGNTSPQASDSVTVGDTTAPDAPTVVITEDTNNDGTLANSEIDGLVDVLVTPPANANVGDTLTVSGQPDRVLTQEDLDNGVSYQYPVPADGESLTVTATITDPSGNTSPQASDSVTVGDTTAPDAPTVVITEDTNNDGTLANSEIEGLVDVLVTPPANANVGDTLTVSGQPDRVLTPGDLENGVSYQYPVPADGESLTVTATVTDSSGNTSPQASDSVTVGDTTAPDAPTVVITEDTNNDGTLSNSEIDGLVDVL